MHLKFFFSLFSLHPTATKKKWRSYCLLEAIMALLVKSFAILCVHAPSVKSYTPGTHCGSNWAFSLTWPAPMQIYWNKWKGWHTHTKKQDWFGTPTCGPPFHCFGTPIWPPWRHVKTLYRPFPSHPMPLFQNVAECEAIDVKIIFHSLVSEIHLHKKGFALRLVSKVRISGTQKWTVFNAK